MSEPQRLSTGPLIAVALVVGVGAAFGGARWAVAREVRSAQPDDTLKVELEALRAEVGQPRAEAAERARTAETLSAPGAGAATRIPVGEIEAAVARWMERNPPGGSGHVGAGALGKAESEDAGAANLRDTATLVDELLAAGLWADGADTLWNELRERGLIDEAVALFEARAEERPNDPVARVQLAAAHLAKVQDVPQGPQSGLWATKADGAYDAALELDDHHWDARFGKATSLSFWPPLFGKQGEAIQNFEVLLEQQQSAAPSPVTPRPTCFSATCSSRPARARKRSNSGSREQHCIRTTRIWQTSWARSATTEARGKETRTGPRTRSKPRVRDAPSAERTG